MSAEKRRNMSVLNILASMGSMAYVADMSVYCKYNHEKNFFVLSTDQLVDMLVVWANFLIFYVVVVAIVQRSEISLTFTFFVIS
jgi:hypothetical protein